jgi:molybdopterin-containing oxidoreductase family iron-sulfur binding subunit
MSQIKSEKLKYWRSIDNRYRTEAYMSKVHNEFAADMTDITAMDRRSMLKVMGASVALAGISMGCRRPIEKILPYVKEPENFTAGVPKFFATAQPTPHGAQAILVESHEGRPTKIEGNPSHPESLGKASTINQAAILELYDPDRSRFCLQRKAGVLTPVEWTEWDLFAHELASSLKEKSGAGLAFLCDSDLSPSFLRIKSHIKNNYPKAKFYLHEPMRQLNVEKASTLAFGEYTRVRYLLDNARIIACLFADPFSYGPEHLKHVRGYAKNRTVHSVDDTKSMNRLYAIEADFSLAGINADHRLRMPVGLAKNIVHALAYELHATHGINLDIVKPPSFKNIDRKFISILAKDLAQHRGKALIIGGHHLAPEILALIHSINTALQGLNNVFEVVNIDDDLAREHLSEPDIASLSTDIKNQKIDTVVCVNTNPVYSAPRHLNFKEVIAKTKLSIHIGLYQDETAQHCTWHIPKTHFLESFADARAYDGTISIIQPLIEPLHDARSVLHILGALAGLDREPLRLFITKTHEKYNNLDKAIHDGFIENSQWPKILNPIIKNQNIYTSFNKINARNPNEDNCELIINFDRKILDGRYANHSWLQEMPDPVTKINWDNALLMSPTAARYYKIKSGLQKNSYVADLVSVQVGDQALELPVFVMPGLSDYSIVATLGYGRSHAGAVGNNIGIDILNLLTSYENLVQHGVKISRINKTRKISSTQEQFAMNGDTVQETDVLSLQSRDPARFTNIDDYLKDPDGAKHKGMPESLLVREKNKKEEVPLQITKPWDYSKGNQWGMVIDLAKCIGCNACMIACQSENNIPVVGREQVIRGRMMQWIRVDRYFVGDVKNPRAITQPVPCMHCENAPCEPVCPVAATSHDKEGLNVMTYNRCVGTRYCANNCPYKVRRFNYFDYTNTGNLHVDKDIQDRQKTIKLQRNPDVTVRYRGVMEKCTYCTQRIQEARMTARRAGQDPNNLADGAVTPACAQTCPADAIVFGNINDENSRVNALKKVDRNFSMLEVLNSRPRTSYLSLLKNTHPELVEVHV